MSIKNFLINIGSSYAHIILSVVLNILYVPIMLNYMGVERYGVWLVLQTLINYLTLANFGIPTAVTNLMSQSESDSHRLNLFYKGSKILGLICLIILIICVLTFFLIIQFTDWSSSLSFEIKTSSLILIVFFILRIPFQMSSSIFIATKKVFISKIYEVLTIIITFGSLLITIFFRKDLIFLAFISGVLLLTLNLISYFNAVRMLKVDDNDQIINTITNKDIYKPGVALFAAGIGSLVIWNTDNLIISKLFGFQEVAVYSTAFRLFSMGFMSFNIIYGILIPYYGQFYKQKSWQKLSELFRFNLIGIPFIALCVWIVGWMFAREIIMLWLGDLKLYAGSEIYFLLGAYGLSLAYVGTMFSLLTSLNLLKSLFFMTIAEAMANLVGSIAFAKIFGYQGVIYGTLLASIIVPLLFLPKLINRNKLLQINFPYREFSSSIVFYVAILLFLYLIKADDFNLLVKVGLVVVLLLVFIAFQYFSNRKLLIKVFQQIIPGSKTHI